MENSSEKRPSRTKSFFQKIPGYARKGGSSGEQVTNESESIEHENIEDVDLTLAFKTRKQTQYSDSEPEHSDDSHPDSDDTESGDEDESSQISQEKYPIHEVRRRRSSGGDYSAVDNFSEEQTDSDVEGSSVSHQRAENTPSVTKSDWSYYTGETLRHSNVSSIPNYKTKVNVTSRASDPGSLLTDESEIDGKRSSNKQLKNSRGRKDNKKKKQKYCVNDVQLRNWVIIFLFFISFFMSTYSSLGCKFLTLNIGFNPTNIQWKRKVDFGPLSYSSSSLTSSDASESSKCLSYPPDFYDKYISTDSTWKVLRSFVILSLILHCFVFLIILFMGVKSDFVPMSTRLLRVIHIYWKKCLMVLVGILMLLEGSKFIFLSNKLCNSSIWVTESQSNIKVAKSCEPNTGLHVTIFSMLFYFIICLIICTAPRDIEFHQRLKNELNPEYNIVNQYISDEETAPSSKEPQMDDLITSQVETDKKSEKKGKFFRHKVS